MGEHAGERQPVIDVYARISRAVNGETIKTDYQVEVCSEELAERGARVGRVFTDPSLSAWQRDVVRPDWVKLMDRLESGQSDGVMFYDVTRFSRKIIEGERLVEAAERGMRVWSLTGEYDLATADGRRHFREDMVSAASESDKMSERIRHGKVRRARRGRLAGGGRGYGMPGLAPKPDGWHPDDPREMVPGEQVAAERAVIAECCRRILGGEPLPAVVRDLDRRGLRTVTGKRWTRNGLRQMLDRPALAGLLTHHGTVVGRLSGSGAGHHGGRVGTALGDPGRPSPRPPGSGRAHPDQHDGVRQVRAPDAGHHAGQPSAVPGRVTRPQRAVPQGRQPLRLRAQLH